MLDSWGGSAVWKGLTPFFQGVDPSIWPNPVNLGLIWLYNPLPILYCPVFMVLGKFEMILSMLLLKKRALLLDDRGKPILLKDIPDCLSWDRINKDAVNEIDNLNSIVKLSSSDLVKNRLFIIRGKLGRSITLIVFFVCVHLFLDSTNGRLPYTSFGLDFMNRIVFIKKGDDGRVLSR